MKKWIASGGRWSTDGSSQKDGQLLYRTRCPSPSSISTFHHRLVTKWVHGGRYQQFIRKNIDVSRRDEMLHRQKVFWVLVLPNQIWTWAIKSSNQVKHQVRLHVVVATASQQPTKKHKQCSRVSVETSTTSTNLSNPGWSFDQQVGRQLESVNWPKFLSKRTQTTLHRWRDWQSMSDLNFKMALFSISFRLFGFPKSICQKILNLISTKVFDNHANCF